jgi:hypothetical protein
MLLSFGSGGSSPASGSASITVLSLSSMFRRELTSLSRRDFSLYSCSYFHGREVVFVSRVFIHSSDVFLVAVNPFGQAIREQITQLRQTTSSA